MFLAAIPLLLFPRHLRKPVTVSESRVNEEDKTAAEKMRHALQRRVSEISDVQGKLKDKE